MNKSLCVLIVDKAWAKLYQSSHLPFPPTLVYQQGHFGGEQYRDNTTEQLARSLCRILRADQLAGKFAQLVILASDEMHAALRKQYAGDWQDVMLGRIEDLPVRYSDSDLGEYLGRLLLHD